MFPITPRLTRKDRGLGPAWCLVFEVLSPRWLGLGGGRREKQRGEEPCFPPCLSLCLFFSLFCIWISRWKDTLTSILTPSIPSTHMAIKIQARQSQHTVALWARYLWSLHRDACPRSPSTSALKWALFSLLSVSDCYPTLSSHEEPTNIYWR